MDYPTFGNISLGIVSGNIKLYVNDAGLNIKTGIGYNNNSMTFGVDQSITATSQMTINKFGNLGVVGNVNTGGNIFINGMASSTTPTTGALTVAGGIGVVGNLNIGGLTYHGYDTSFNGNTQILSQTASTSTSSGALRVDGGAGIVGNLNIGGFSRFAFDSSFNGNIQLTQSNNPLWFVTNNASSFNGTLASGTDVGIFYGTTNPAPSGLVISPRGTGGGIKMASNGNVGIGVMVPIHSLHVVSSTTQGAFTNTADNTEGTLISSNGTTSEIKMNNGGSAHFSIINDGSFKINNTSSSPSPFTTGTNVITVLSTLNNVGIGITNPTATLHVYQDIDTSVGSRISKNFGATINFTAGNYTNWQHQGQLEIFNTSTSASLSIALSSDNIGIIQPKQTGLVYNSLLLNPLGGNVSIGTTSYASYKLQVNGTIGLSGAITGATATNTINGIIINNSAVSNITTLSASGQITGASFNATSDYRMKQNSQPLLITRSIDLLKPVEYDLSGGKHDMGFLAHEVQEVLPFLVTGEKDGPGMQSINYNGFIALLVKEVQELKKENRELMKMKAVQEQQTQIQQQQQSEIKSLQEDIKLLLLLRS